MPTMIRKRYGAVHDSILFYSKSENSDMGTQYSILPRSFE